MSHIITDANFNETINSGKLVLIDFWATWCAPCKQIAPIIDQLAHDYKDKNVIIGKMDVDRNRIVPMQQGIRQVPTLLLFRDGKLIDRIPMAFGRHAIETKILQHIR